MITEKASRGEVRTRKVEVTEVAEVVKKFHDTEVHVVRIRSRAESVAAALGGKSALARAMGVSASQPTQWIKGAERPSLENARVIVDLDYVVARAGLLWKPPVVQSWLVGRNAFLGGARPIDVVKMEGSGRVIDALDQELSGAYA